MRIDAHQSFTSQYTPEQLWPILERNRFDGSVLIQTKESDIETDRALSLATEHHFIKAVVVWVDLSSPNLGNRLDRLQTDSKCKGVYHRLTTEPDAAAGLIEMARRGLTLDLELHPQQLTLITALMETSPELKLIVNHLGSPSITGGDFERWALQMEQVSKIANVAVKISGLVTLNRTHAWNAMDLSPFVQHAIRCFGPERLMFGSDWPTCLAAGTWKESLAAFTQSIGPHSIAFREQLLGGTANRLYKVLT